MADINQDNQDSLEELWIALGKKIGKKVDGFTVGLEEFRTHMADEEMRTELHSNLPEYFPGFNMDYETFSDDMGFKKKVEEEIIGKNLSPKEKGSESPSPPSIVKDKQIPEPVAEKAPDEVVEPPDTRINDMITAAKMSYQQEAKAKGLEAATGLTGDRLIIPEEQLARIKKVNEIDPVFRDCMTPENISDYKKMMVHSDAYYEGLAKEALDERIKEKNLLVIHKGQLQFKKKDMAKWKEGHIEAVTHLNPKITKKDAKQYFMREEIPEIETLMTNMLLSHPGFTDSFVLSTEKEADDFKKKYREQGFYDEAVDIAYNNVYQRQYRDEVIKGGYNDWLTDTKKKNPGASEEEVYKSMAFEAYTMGKRFFSPEDHQVAEDIKKIEETQKQLDELQFKGISEETYPEYQTLLHKVQDLKEGVAKIAGKDREEVYDYVTGERITDPDFIAQHEEDVKAKMEEIAATINATPGSTNFRDELKTMWIEAAGAVNYLKKKHGEGFSMSEAIHDPLGLGAGLMKMAKVPDGVKMVTPKEQKHYRDLTRNAMLEFDALSRFYLLNESPANIDKNWSYYKQTIGNDIMRWVPLTDEAYMNLPSTERNFLDAIQMASEREGIGFSDKEKEKFERTLTEHSVEFGIGLVPIMVQLGLLNKVVGMSGATKFLQSLSKGSKIQKMVGFLGDLALEEAKLQTAGFPAGEGVGFGLAHKIPMFKLPGKWGVMAAPFIRSIWLGSFAATLGLETAKASSITFDAFMNDKDWTYRMDQYFGDMDENQKRWISALIVNQGIGTMNYRFLNSAFVFGEPKDIMIMAEKAIRRGDFDLGKDLVFKAKQIDYARDMKTFETFMKNRKAMEQKILDNDAKPEQVADINRWLEERAPNVLVRTGDLSGVEGTTFAGMEGKNKFMDPRMIEEGGNVVYDVKDVIIADIYNKETRDKIIDKAIKFGEHQLSRIPVKSVTHTRERLEKGLEALRTIKEKGLIADFMDANLENLIVTAAQSLQFDGIHVWDVKRPDVPTERLIWNVENVKPIKVELKKGGAKDVVPKEKPQAPEKGVEAKPKEEPKPKEEVKKEPEIKPEKPSPEKPIEKPKEELLPEKKPVEKPKEKIEKEIPIKAEDVKDKDVAAFIKEVKKGIKEDLEFAKTNDNKFLERVSKEDLKLLETDVGKYIDKRVEEAEKTRIKGEDKELDGLKGLKKKLAAIPIEKKPEKPVGKLKEKEVKKEPEKPAEEKPIETHKAVADDISKDIAERAYRGTSFDSEKRGESFRKDYVEIVNKLHEDLSKIATTPERKKVLEESFPVIKEKYKSLLMDYLHSRSGIFSSMIVGPARFPAEKMRKKNASTDKKYDAAQDFLEKAEKRIKKQMKDAATPEQKAAEGWDEMEDAILKRVVTIDNIDAGKEHYDRQAFVNGIVGRIKRAADNGKFDVAQKGLDLIEKLNKERKKPIISKRNSVWDYVEKAREQVKEKPIGEKAVKTYEGAEVINNHDADRTQIYFDEKPSNDIRRELKSHGWHWSPKNGVWQRKLTRDSEWNAKDILDRFFKEKEAKKEPTVPAEKEKPVEGLASIERLPTKKKAVATTIDQKHKAQKKIDEGLSQIMEVMERKLTKKLVPDEPRDEKELKAFMEGSKKVLEGFIEKGYYNFVEILNTMRQSLTEKQMKEMLPHLKEAYRDLYLSGKLEDKSLENMISPDMLSRYTDEHITKLYKENKDGELFFTVGEDFSEKDVLKKVEVLGEVKAKKSTNFKVGANQIIDAVANDFIDTKKLTPENKKSLDNLLGDVKKDLKGLEFKQDIGPDITPDPDTKIKNEILNKQVQAVESLSALRDLLESNMGLFDRASIDKAVKAQKRMVELMETIRQESHKAISKENQEKIAYDYLDETSPTEQHFASPEKISPKEPRIAIEPISEKFTDSPLGLEELLAKVSKRTGKRMHVSKPKRKGAAGEYSPQWQSIRIKRHNQIDVFAHELGHFVDDVFGVMSEYKDDLVSPYDNELKPFWVHGSKPPSNLKTKVEKRRYIRAEGVAEWIRAYIVNPTAAKKAAPEFYKNFEKKISSDFLDAIHDYSSLYRAWAGQSATNMTLGQIAKDTKIKHFAGFEFKNWHRKRNYDDPFSFTVWDKMREIMSDDLRFFKIAFDVAKKNNPRQILPDADANILLSVFSDVGNLVDRMLRFGLMDTEKNRRYDSEGNVMNLSYLFKKLRNDSYPETKRELELVVSYMVSQRTPEMRKNLPDAKVLTGVGGGVFSDVSVAKATLAEIAELKTTDRGKFDRIVESARRYREWADANLRYMVEGGRMSENVYQKIKKRNDYYVSMQRVMSSAPGEEIFMYAKLGKGPLGYSSEPFHTIKGSSRTMKNPYESLIHSTHQSVRETDRNKVVLSFVDAFDFRREQYDPVDVMPGMDQLVRRIEGPRTIVSKDAKGKIRYEKTAEPKEPHVVVYRDGVKEYYGIHEIIDVALNQLGSEKKLPYAGVELIMKGASVLPQLTRRMIIYSPFFPISNTTRDIFHRLVVSATTKSGVTGIKDMLGGEVDLGALRDYGGDMAGFYYKDKYNYAKLMKRIMKDEISKGKSIIVDPTKMTKAFSRGYMDYVESGETANRLAEFRSAYRHAKYKLGYSEHNSKLYAAFRARELIDFAVAGTLMRQINRICIFSNPAIQGLKSVVRSARRDPAKMGLAFAKFVVMPTAMEYAMAVAGGYDDERRQLPSYIKDLYWNFKVGPDVWVRVPKPFELGVASSILGRILDASIPMKVTDASGKVSYVRDKHALDGYLMSVVNAFQPFDKQSLLSTPLMPLPGGLVDVVVNRDIFRDSYIVPPHQQYLGYKYLFNKRTGERYDVRASRLGKAIGKGIGVDARKIDHMIGKQFAYFGQYARIASDIGRKDKRSINVKMTPFVRSAPGFESRDVQWVMKKARKIGLVNAYGRTTNTEYGQLIDLLRHSYNAEKDVRSDPKNKNKSKSDLRKLIRQESDKRKEEVRTHATGVMIYWEKMGLPE